MARRSASATVEESGRLLVIDAKTVEAMGRGNAEIAVRLIKKLAGRLQETDHHIENLLLRDGNSRVVHFLSHIGAKQGQQTAEGLLLEAIVQRVPDKPGAGAALLGTSLPTFRQRVALHRPGETDRSES